MQVFTCSPRRQPGGLWRFLHSAREARGMFRVEGVLGESAAAQPPRGGCGARPGNACAHPPPFVHKILFKEAHWCLAKVVSGGIGLPSAFEISSGLLVLGKALTRLSRRPGYACTCLRVHQCLPGVVVEGLTPQHRILKRSTLRTAHKRASSWGPGRCYQGGGAGVCALLAACQGSCTSVPTLTVLHTMLELLPHEGADLACWGQGQATVRREAGTWGWAAESATNFIIHVALGVLGQQHVQRLHDQVGSSGPWFSGFAACRSMLKYAPLQAPGSRPPRAQFLPLQYCLHHRVGM